MCCFLLCHCPCYYTVFKFDPQGMPFFRIEYYNETVTRGAPRMPQGWFGTARTEDLISPRNSVIFDCYYICHSFIFKHAPHLFLIRIEFVFDVLLNNDHGSLLAAPRAVVSTINNDGSLKRSRAISRVFCVLIMYNKHKQIIICSFGCWYATKRQPSLHPVLV